MPENSETESDNMESQNPHNPSHLFLVRLWPESNNEGDAVWCGKVQHVTRGGANQFRDWPALVDILMTMLPDAARLRQHKVVEE
jgi:hypothetical protein